MQLIVNGQPRELATHATLLTLLDDLKLRTDQVAVEVNRKLVRTSKYDQPLNDGDIIEIVTFVGGG